MNFDFLEIKKLISTHYQTTSPSYKLEISRDVNGVSNASVKTLLKQNGDFRSPECIEILKEADIVITNPPFSLFREYVAQLVVYNKLFLIVGNKNSITYKEVFPLIKGNNLWIGTMPMGYDMLFNVPDEYAQKMVDGGKVGSNYKIVNGAVYCRAPSIWFTNLDHKKRHEYLILYKKYTQAEYPKYDNYDAINIDKVKDIPVDYDGAMGVPITFMDKYNPEQFEIVGATESEGKGFSAGLWHEQSKVSQPLVNGVRVYKRIFIKRKS